MAQRDLARPGSESRGAESVRALAPGAAAGALAVALQWTVSRVAPTLDFPPFSLAERVIRLTPGDVATFFIERFEHLALPLLAAGVAVGFLVAAAVLPLATRHMGWLSGAAFAGGLFGLLTFAAAAAAPAPAPVASMAALALASGVLYGATLHALEELSDLYRAESVDHRRRRTLVWLAGAAGALAAGGTAVATLLGRPPTPNRDVVLARADRVARRSGSSFPAIPGLSPEVTPVSDHYVVDIDLTDPVVDAEGWTLEVAGEVDRALELSFDELQREFALVEQHSVLTCISNPVGGPLIGSSKWTGVRLADVLARARVKSGAVDVVFEGADGYTASIPVGRALEPPALLAIAQNGRPLTQEHGFPCRVRVPALYGIKNAKWLQRIEVVGFDQRSYWTERGWTDIGEVRTESRIDTVGDPRAGMPTWIAGVAWAGERGISRVEVSLDGGRAWRDARLRRPLSGLAWTQWAYRWTPRRRGRHQLAVRAADGAGTMQDERSRPPHPSGASGYHRLAVEVA